MKTTAYNKPTIIINYLCDNTRLGMDNTTAKVEIPYSSITLRKVMNDPQTFQERISHIALKRCPFNQLQRVKCDIYAYNIVIGNKPTDGILKLLYENVKMISFF